MPALVGSDLRADRELGSCTSRAGAPRRCDYRTKGIGTKERTDHEEMMVVEGKRASVQRKVGLAKICLIPLRSLLLCKNRTSKSFVRIPAIEDDDEFEFDF